MATIIQLSFKDEEIENIIRKYGSIKKFKEAIKELIKPEVERVAQQE